MSLLKANIRSSDRQVVVIQEPPSSDSNLVELRDKLREAFQNGIRVKKQPELTLDELVNSYKTSFGESLVARNYGEQTLRDLVKKVCGDIFARRFCRNMNKDMFSLKPSNAGTPKPLVPGEESGEEAASTEEFRPVKKAVQLTAGSGTPAPPPSFQQSLMGKAAIVPQGVVGTNWGGGSRRLVKTLSEVDAVAGQICMLQAPILNAAFLRMLRISNDQWTELYTLLRWYASGPDDDRVYIRLETFSALYGYYFGRSLIPREFGVADNRQLFLELQEWVEWDYDNAGFMWVHLRTEPRQKRKDTSYISKKSSDQNPLKKKMAEGTDTSFALPPAPPGLPATSLVDAETRVNLYALVLCHFPLGMDSTELVSAYGLAIGHSLKIPEDLDANALFWGLQDLFVVEKKSPLHSIVYVRLDIPVMGLNRETLIASGLEWFYDYGQNRLKEKKEKKAAEKVENCD